MIEIEPGFYGAYWLKGAIRLAEGRYADAVEELTRAVSLGGHHDRHRRPGDQLTHWRREGNTLRRFSINFRDAPPPLRARNLYGACVLPTGTRRGTRSNGWRRRSTSETARWCSCKERSPEPPRSDSLNRLGSDPRVKICCGG